MARRVLRHRDAEMLAQSPEHGACRSLAVPLDRDALDEHEAASVLQHVGKALQLASQGRQREVAGRHLQQGDTALPDRAQSGLEFVDLRRRQSQDPLL
jgi:hypothetical protein